MRRKKRTKSSHQETGDANVVSSQPQGKIEDETGYPPLKTTLSKRTAKQSELTRVLRERTAKDGELIRDAPALLDELLSSLLEISGSAEAAPVALPSSASSSSSSPCAPTGENDAFARPSSASSTVGESSNVTGNSREEAWSAYLATREQTFPAFVRGTRVGFESQRCQTDGAGTERELNWRMHPGAAPSNGVHDEAAVASTTDTHHDGSAPPGCTPAVGATGDRMGQLTSRSVPSQSLVWAAVAMVAEALLKDAMTEEAVVLAKAALAEAGLAGVAVVEAEATLSPSLRDMSVADLTQTAAAVSDGETAVGGTGARLLRRALEGDPLDDLPPQTAKLVLEAIAARTDEKASEAALASQALVSQAASYTASEATNMFAYAVHEAQRSSVEPQDVIRDARARRERAYWALERAMRRPSWFKRVEPGALRIALAEARVAAVGGSILERGNQLLAREDERLQALTQPEPTEPVALALVRPMSSHPFNFWLMSATEHTNCRGR